MLRLIDDDCGELDDDDNVRNTRGKVRPPSTKTMRNSINRTTNSRPTSGLRSKSTSGQDDNRTRAGTRKSRAKSTNEKSSSHIENTPGRSNDSANVNDGDIQSRVEGRLILQALLRVSVGRAEDFALLHNVATSLYEHEHNESELSNTNTNNTKQQQGKSSSSSNSLPKYSAAVIDQLLTECSFREEWRVGREDEYLTTIDEKQLESIILSDKESLHTFNANIKQTPSQQQKAMRKDENSTTTSASAAKDSKLVWT